MTKVEDILKAKGLTVKDLEKLLKGQEVSKKVIKAKKTSKYRFGIVSDTHLVDKSCAISELEDFYKKCKALGVTEIVHAGDIASGVSVYRSQLNDINCFGFDDHVKFVVDNYPKIDGITTYFIAGNHDENYEVAFGASLGEHIAKARKDLVYVGMYDSEVVLNGIRIGLHHGAKSVPYSVSYHLQKYIEKLPAGKKPQIYVLGHYHATLYMFYRNIHCFLPGCFQKGNYFSVRLGLPSNIGGWIIELEIADDKFNTITSITTQYIAYY